MQLFRILYIEDDEIDRRNMEWICSYLPKVELLILDDFSELERGLQFKPDLIITDRYIDDNCFSEKLAFWIGTPYYVLSNSVVENLDLRQQPIEYLPKPLAKSKLEEVVKNAQASNAPNTDKNVATSGHSDQPNLKDLPNLAFFDQIPNAEMRDTMLALLLTELVNAYKDIKHQHQDITGKINSGKSINTSDYEALRQSVHKLASKFSMLEMRQSFDLTRELEQMLLKQKLDTNLVRDLMINVQTCIDFLKNA